MAGRARWFSAAPVARALSSATHGVRRDHGVCGIGVCGGERHSLGGKQMRESDFWCRCFSQNVVLHGGWRKRKSIFLLFFPVQGGDHRSHSVCVLNGTSSRGELRLQSATRWKKRKREAPSSGPRLEKKKSDRNLFFAAAFGAIGASSHALFRSFADAGRRRGGAHPFRLQLPRRVGPVARPVHKERNVPSAARAIGSRKF